MAASRKKTGTGTGTGDRASVESPAHVNLTEFESAVVAVLLATEPGDVLAYGEVAAEAGYPGAARAVGNVLKNIDDLPWWRVVNSTGRLIPHGAVEQAKRLAEEGVPTAKGRIVHQD